MTTSPTPRSAQPTLFPHQEEGLRRTVRHLRRPGSRALYVSATGTGKTVTASRIADALAARLVLFVVPTLDLAAQTALAWRADGRSEPMVIVSSMDASGHDSLVAAHVTSTSQTRTLALLMSSVGPGKDGIPALTVICTYDSLDKIENTLHSAFTVPAFDLAVMDEAHRIAGRTDKKWAAVNDAHRIRADRRLYMTATPRIFAAPVLAESAAPARAGRRTSTEQPGLEALANSMDNEATYGKKVFEYPLAQAIADGMAADYRIVVPTITDTQLRERLNRPASSGQCDSAPGTEDALRTTALHLAVLRAMRQHQLRRILVYFNLVSDAQRFTRELDHTLRLLRRNAPDLCPDTRPELFFVHGEHTPEQRTGIFARFAAADSAILANARLIAEGIDIPSVDAIVFADPTRSVVRCVQALGRALRRDVSGKIASLIVPVYIPPQADPEDILGTPYEPVWAITTALASHDHRILERLPDKTHRLSTETSQLIEHRWHFDFTVRPERIARALDLTSFDPRDSSSRSRRQGLAAAQAFHDTHGHLDVPSDYTDSYGYTLGAFITTMRDARTANRLDTEWIAELDTLDMIWDKHDAAWRARLTAAADYHRAHGHLAAPATTPTGAWLAEQRSLATHGQLDPARAADLAAIDPDWLLPHGPDWHRKYHLLRAHLAAGNDPHVLDRTTVLGSVKIGSWLHRQLSGWHTLAGHQQRLLTDIGVDAQTHPLTAVRRPRRTFAENVQILEFFLHRERRAPAAREEITVDGDRVRIGSWLAKARSAHRSGQLSSERVALVAPLFHGDWTDESAPPAVQS
ncbi:Helicase associated domain protein [Streptomyces sp. SLBN-8D4]|uniref:helicase associated domain-containing protein n=1 Tax=Streptomyces sp. SLBN-8D4 TaxID=3377728 RepID=UPI003C7E2330